MSNATDESGLLILVLITVLLGWEFCTFQEFKRHFPGITYVEFLMKRKNLIIPSKASLNDFMVIPKH